MSMNELRAGVASALRAKVAHESGAASLLSLDDYRAQRENIFPSLSSFQWWLRAHRRLAIEAGALLLVRGRYHVIPEKMDACIAAAGEEAARRQLVPA